MVRFALLFLAVVLLPAGEASAHKPSDSYLSLDVSGDAVTGQWDIAVRDLGLVLPLDANRDGAVTWGELKDLRAEIFSYAFARLALDAAGEACPIEPRGLLVDHHTDGAYAVLRFAAACAEAGAELGVSYDLLFELDPQHRGLLRFTAGAATESAVFAPDRRRLVMRADARDVMRTLVHYVKEGIHHIWIGYDHILFLVALLLPLGVGRGEAGMRARLVTAAKIVTAFTIAHSITLAAAALDVVRVPADIVEPLIAASVVLAALNNLFPVVRARLWQLTFAFGLVHGLGFATVLSDLGLAEGALVLSLLGFNAGVEVGQLAIVLCLLPVLFVLGRVGDRTLPRFSRTATALASMAVAAAGSLWLIERTVGLPA